jgi:tetratricopeptide (TPR) repeat protein
MPFDRWFGPINSPFASNPMNALLSRCNKAVWLAAALLAVTAGTATAEPFIPRDDSVVLEHVTSRHDPAARELRDLQVRLSTNPTNLAIATDLARRYIELNRAEGDPRYLGRAQSALGPWWDQPQPPVDALVLRATLKQSLHDFPAALLDLDLAVHLAPDNAQAWLTRATILTVRGEYSQARRCCLALARLAPELAVITASATIAGLTGQAERSCTALRQTLDRNGSSPAEEKLWALTVCAESWARLGRVAEAETSFRQSLGLGVRDVYSLAAYADFLLDLGRPEEAAALLRNETRVDGLLLRITLAEAAEHKPPASLKRHVENLTERFAAARLRGDFVHQREESRFALHLLKDPSQALRTAQANWSVQHEPADIRVLLEAALAARDPGSAASAVRFVEDSRLEDVHIRQLCDELKRLEAR